MQNGGEGLPSIILTSRGLLVKMLILLNRMVYFNQRGSCMVWEINMGVCLPRLEFDDIMFINCLGYDFYIYGTF